MSIQKPEYLSEVRAAEYVIDRYALHPLEAKQEAEDFRAGFDEGLRAAAELVTSRSMDPTNPSAFSLADLIYEQVSQVTRATPGDRIRITVDQFGAPVGSVVEVYECGPRWASYTFAKGDGRATTYLAGHDSYEIINLEETK